MRTLLLLATVGLAAAACGGDAPSPAPAAASDTFAFDSGGAYHIQGFGAWQVRATRAGHFEVTHQVGDEVSPYPATPLADADRSALWAAVDGAGLEALVVVDRPGVPDESIYTFTLRRAEETLAQHEVWQNDLAKHPSLTPLLQVLKDLIEKQHGVKPAF